MTVKEIIDGIIQKTGVEPLAYDKTCDHLMTGSFESEVTKIVTTFMATVEVIEKAIEIGANFIITHEPTWFTGVDNTDWLEEDPIYLEKKKLIEKHQISIWRFHDHMHMDQKEDGIYRGFNKEINWEAYQIEGAEGTQQFGAYYQIPKTTLGQLSQFFKQTLEMDVIQIVGNPDMPVELVGIFVGGGSLCIGHEELPMESMRKNNLDVLVCGDILEWTISAYVRDAAALGFNRSMLVLGHERSEEAGMKYLGEWMKDITKEIEVVFVDSKEPFTYL